LRGFEERNLFFREGGNFARRRSEIDRETRKNGLCLSFWSFTGVQARIIGKQ